MTPIKPGAVPVAGWHMFCFVCCYNHCMYYLSTSNWRGVSIIAFALTVLTKTVPMEKAIVGFGTIDFDDRNGLLHRPGDSLRPADCIELC